MPAPQDASRPDGRFAGFPPAGLDFLRGLEEDNSKAYFDAHRDLYETALREPLELLLAEAVRRYGPGKVFRPNRDVRFGPDKRPYKTTASLVAGEGVSVYVSVSPAGMMVGGGLYEPAREQLARARTAIAEHRSAGGELDTILGKLTASELTPAGPGLKTAPRGYPRDHPRIELLRMTRYAALASFPPGPALHDPEACRNAIFGTWKRLEPLLDWLRTHVVTAPVEVRRQPRLT